MKTKDIRALSDEELRLKKQTIKQELLTYRFKARAGTLEKPSIIRQSKKDVAKIETILKERENEGKKAADTKR